tara:strand:- start:47884 stop:48699 length:816 start_codon:yes stop_codon:yes gene_type:complete
VQPGFKNSAWLASALFFLAVNLPAAPLDRFQATIEQTALGPMYRSPSGVANVPLVLPLEADLLGDGLPDRPSGDLKLSSNRPLENPFYLRSNRYLSLDGNTGHFALQFRDSRIYQRSALELSFLDPRRAYSPSNQLHQMDLIMQYRTSRFSLLFDIGHEETLALESDDPQQKVSAGLSVGYGLSSASPISVLLGLQSRHQITDPFRDNQIIGARYGTLFFTPGIQIATSTMILEATLEVPMHTYDLRPEQSPITPVESDLKARFGMKYLLQ